MRRGLAGSTPQPGAWPSRGSPPTSRREPHGFDCRLMVVVGLMPEDLAVANGPHPASWLPDLHVTPASAGAHVAQRNDLVARVDEPVALQPDVLECLGEHLLKLAHSIVAAKRTRIGCVGVLHPDDLGVEQRERGLHIGVVDRTMKRSDDLNVLLGHRGRSISTQGLTLYPEVLEAGGGSERCVAVAGHLICSPPDE